MSRSESADLPTVKLADFGISILLEDGAEESALQATAPTAEASESAFMAMAQTLSTGEPPGNAQPFAPTQFAESASASLRGLTRTGHIVGTPLYMAPELVHGSKLAKPSADLFSLGVIAFEILSGQPPFDRPAIIVRALHQEIPVPSVRERCPDLKPELAKLLDACLHSDPLQRPSAKKLAAELGEIAQR